MATPNLALPRSIAEAVAKHRPIAMIGGKYCVVGLNTKRMLGRHPSYKEALGQLREVEHGMHS